jgi:acetyl esterase/lipase
MNPRKIGFLLAVATFALSAAAFAQNREFAIWPGKSAPGSENWRHKEIQYTFPSPRMKMVRNVVKPTLTLFAPERSLGNGTAVIVAPGGGMRFLSWENEGTAAAEWLATRGVTAFVLKYRLLETPAGPAEFDAAMKDFFNTITKAAETNPGDVAHSITSSTEAERTVGAMAVADGLQAVRYVREHAAEWGVEPDRIGMIGFSAGAYITAGVLMNHDADSRLNFAAPIYGGETGGKPIPSDNPPIFIVVAQDDNLIYNASQQLFRDWNAARLPVEFHSFAQGGHGFGMIKQGLPIDRWIDLYGEWLDSLGLMKRGDKPHKRTIAGAPTSDLNKH